MKSNVRSSIHFAVNGALALASLAAPSAVANETPAPSDQKAAQINQASLTSVEQSYLKIPGMCKARNAAFDPIVVGREAVSASARAIHAALDAQAVA